MLLFGTRFPNMGIAYLPDNEQLIIRMWKLQAANQTLFKFRM